MSSPHATSVPASSSSSNSKPRRKPLLRKVDSMSSSREASEESNAENDVDSLVTSDASDEVLLPSAVVPGEKGSAVPDAPDLSLLQQQRGSTRPLANRSVPASSTRTLLAHSTVSGDATGEESSASTYDGDVSSATVASRRPHHASRSGGGGGAAAAAAAAADSSSATPASHSTDPLASGTASHFASLPRADKPVPSSSGLSATASPPSSCPPSPEFSPPSALRPQRAQDENAEAHAPAPRGLISKLSPQELQEFIRQIISGEALGPSGLKRQYPINPPPVDRPVRIYADGVYDLFHYAHALQLRQAKHFFPDVHLLVGVSSDELVKSYKASPVLTSAERYESVRNCKWVDEVIEDAPWEVTQDFIDKHHIDYVAHDEEPYVSSTSSDVYAYAKSVGRFLPTRRTSGISTSELLSRIVEGYRGGDYDNKLEKIGRSDIMSRGASRAASDSGSRAADDVTQSPVVGSMERLTTRDNTHPTGSGSGTQSPTKPSAPHPLEKSQLA